METLPAHSPLGASACKRWKNCPGSVALCKQFPSTSSEYAAEGSVAHDLGEKILLTRREIQQFLGVVTEYEGFKIEITQEMIDAVIVYVSHVMELKRLDKKSEVLLEQKFHMKDLHPALFGTSDAVVYSPGTKTLYVRDYKHGAGVPVEVEGNEQLMYYALGALLENSYPVGTVDVGIVQPRIDHPDGPVRSVKIDVLDLMEWSADLVDWAKATEVDDAPLNPGPAQCKWCDAKAFCPALQASALEIAKDDFPMEVAQYDLEQLAGYLDKLDIIENWCKAVREFAYKEAERGVGIPGHKLVQKQARRYWKGDVDIEAALLKYGMDKNDYLKPGELKSPAQIDKILGKSKDDVKDLWEKKSSGTTLVQESDKRPAISCNPADDFAD